MKLFIYKILLILGCITLFSESVIAADVSLIVNANNPISSITSEDLRSFFIKKNRSWKNGKAVRFFDHRDENNNRKIFLKKYIKKTSREIELYWIGEKIYTGNIAPIQVTSDSMMANMVSRFSGGIGFVSSHYAIPATVKRITVINNSGKD